MFQENLISVIVPIYNAGNFLEQCIRSILNQTYKNLEIILVNDGSDDGSGELCEKFRHEDQRIKVIHKENGGLVSAWQKGLEETYDKSKFVVFVDADDWIEHEHINCMVQEQIRTDADIVAVCMKEISSRSHKFIEFIAKEKFYDEDMLQHELYPCMLNAGGFEKRGVPVSRCSKLMRKELLLDNLKYCNAAVTFEEDLNIMFPILMDIKSISLLKRKNSAYCYRKHDGSMLHAYDGKKRTSIAYVYSSLIKACEEKNKEGFINQIYEEYLAAQIRCYTNELRNPEGYEVIKRNIQEISNDKILKRAIKIVNWHDYPKKFVLIIHIIKNFNWFHANITTRILKLVQTVLQ